MIATTYQNAGDFLAKTQTSLETNEAANNLLLGTCIRLQNHPNRNQSPPYLVTVEDERGLVLAGVMTPPQKLVIYSDLTDLAQAPDLIIRDLQKQGLSAPGVLGPSTAARQFAERWTQVTGQAHRAGMSQRVYELRQMIQPQTDRGRLRLATEDDLDLVTTWAYGFQQEALSVDNYDEARHVSTRKLREREIYIWEDSQPVSMAATARPTANGITVNLVYTPPALRGKGYASACVAALSQQMLDRGYKFCALFTDLANSTSNHIYQNIGYQPVCDFNEYIFETGEHDDQNS